MKNDIIKLYKLAEANKDKRIYSIFSQFKELKKYYPELTPGFHAKIIREYLK